LFLGWLTTPATDPQQLIRDLAQDERGHWRKALVLANLLRDPDYAEIRRDADIATQLAAVLDARIEQARMDEEQIQLRVFLCRALGEFETAEVLPVLMRAGLTERDPAESDVRRAAVEAITVVVSRIGTENLRDPNPLVSMACSAATCYPNRAEEAVRRARLRGSAAFLLGVFGGDQAEGQLVQLLDDPAPDVRFNAATGLARNGRAEAIGVLQEMLDPDSPDALKGEPSGAGRNWKRALVFTNAMRAATRLAAQTPSADFEPLLERLQHLADSDVAQPVQMQARETMLALKSLQAE
jgi:hypothetical protein